jgi:hypothetical protein
VTVTSSIELDGRAVQAVILPRMDGRVLRVPSDELATRPARYVLGRGAARAMPATELALPALALVMAHGPALGLGLDPFCAVAFRTGSASDGRMRIEMTTAFPGSLVPLKEVSRSVVAVSACDPVQALFSAFYATIPDIQPGPAWLHDIRLVYYDYLSDGGQGWFRDIDALAKRIPQREDRGRVLLCLHGWYDYLGRYAFDEVTGRLDREWMAFPSTRRIPMSVVELRHRLAYARERGFRTVLYFADGVLADDLAPGFDPARFYVDAAGRTNFPVWRGPDTVGTNRYQDPSHPAVRRHYLSYLKALIRKFGRDTDGFVWDETFYIRREWVSQTRLGKPAYADRAMMTLVAELVQTTQKLGRGRLAFLVSDSQGTDPYGLAEPPVPNALVAHGTYQDTGGSPGAWPGNLLPNYRNVLFSCMWEPIQHPDWNRVNVEHWGQPQALSNGWGDDEGPAEMAAKHPGQLDDILRRFHAGSPPRERWAPHTGAK